MSLERRRQMIEPEHPRLSVVRQCELVSISRSGLYHRPAGEAPLNLELVKRSNDKFKSNPNYSLAGSYICTKLLIDGIVKAGTAEPKAVVAALEGMKYAGLTGDEESRKGDHQVLKTYYLLKGKAKAKMANKDDYVEVVSSGKSFLPLDQTGCKLA